MNLLLYFLDYDYRDQITEKLEHVTPTVSVKTYGSLGEESPLGATASLLLNDLTSGDDGISLGTSAQTPGSKTSPKGKLGFSSLLATMRPQQRELHSSIWSG
eukprot:03623.XXX_73444_74503_1 [CDS] Oithona nana genome sequencing.